MEKINTVNRFTFKNVPAPTGLAAIGHKKSIDIKVNKKVVGRIYQKEWDHWYVALTVKKNATFNETSNCDWLWIYPHPLSHFSSSDEAKAYLNEKFIERYNNKDIPFLVLISND